MAPGEGQGLLLYVGGGRGDRGAHRRRASGIRRGDEGRSGPSDPTHARCEELLGAPGRPSPRRRGCIGSRTAGDHRGDRSARGSWIGLVRVGGDRSRDEQRIVEVVFGAELPDTNREPRSASADEEPAFVPLEELGSLPMYPPIAGYLRGADREGFNRGARYLGNLWRSMSALEDWAS